MLAIKNMDINLVFMYLIISLFWYYFLDIIYKNSHIRAIKTSICHKNTIVSIY